MARCCAAKSPAVETDQELVEYPHDRSVDFGIHRLANRLSAAQRNQSQCDKCDGS